MAKLRPVSKVSYSMMLFVAGKRYMLLHLIYTPCGPMRYIPLPAFFYEKEPSVKSFQVSTVAIVGIGFSRGSMSEVSIGGKVIGVGSEEIVQSATKSTSACVFIAFRGLKTKLNSLNSILHLIILPVVAIHHPLVPECGNFRNTVSTSLSLSLR